MAVESKSNRSCNHRITLQCGYTQTFNWTAIRHLLVPKMRHLTSDNILYHRLTNATQTLRKSKYNKALARSNDGFTQRANDKVSLAQVGSSINQIFITWSSWETVLYVLRVCVSARISAIITGGGGWASRFESTEHWPRPTTNLEQSNNLCLYINYWYYKYNFAGQSVILSNSVNFGGSRQPSIAKGELGGSGQELGEFNPNPILVCQIGETAAFVVR